MPRSILLLLSVTVAVALSPLVAPSHHSAPHAAAASTSIASFHRAELHALAQQNARLVPAPRRSPVRATRARRTHAPSTPVCTIKGIRSSVSSGEAFIIQRESGWSVTSYNPINTTTGHAFGLGQLTDHNRERYAARLGVASYTRNACDQLKMMRMYIHERYGSTDAAVAFWHKHHWY